MRQYVFKAWHEGNQKCVYTTLKGIWKNGWGCCEGLRDFTGKNPRNEHILKFKQDGLFTADKCLEEQAQGAFMSSADWEFLGELDD